MEESINANLTFTIMKTSSIILSLFTSLILLWGCSGDSEVDAYLDSYEEVVEECESMAQKGEISESDLERLTARSTEFAEKASESQSGSDWSVGQFARYQELTTRFSTALSNMN